MPKPSPTPRPPTKRQREIGERFKAGTDMVELAFQLVGANSTYVGRPCSSFETAIVVVERAIRACLVWGRRNDL